MARKAYQEARDLPIQYLDPIQFPLFGNIYSRSNIVDTRIMGESYDVVEKLVNQIMSIGRNTKGVAFVYTELALNKPEVRVRVDLERAANFGFYGKDIADAVEAAVGGQQARSQYDVSGRYFYITIIGRDSTVTTVGDVEKILLTSPLNPNIQVPLIGAASVETTVGPLQINHYNGKRSARVQLTIQGRPLSEVFGEVSREINRTVALPIGYGVVPFGAVTNLKTLIQSISFIFPLSVTVVYLLLVMQFQSFIRPLSIILSVPLSIIGANVLVNVSGVHFDSFTMLGYIMMVGLVVKNAIIVITYAVQLINQGMGRDEALVLACRRRMRPIFMTAIAMLLGMLPLALKHGAGAEIYNGLAMAAVGGLSVTTLFTLVFIPVVYTILDDLKNRIWKVRSPILDESDERTAPAEGRRRLPW
ncbi:MAG: efflux RND transporter permease subunit [Pseudomonadota bacterium]